MDYLDRYLRNIIFQDKQVNSSDTFTVFATRYITRQTRLFINKMSHCFVSEMWVYCSVPVTR